MTILVMSLVYKEIETVAQGHPAGYSTTILRVVQRHDNDRTGCYRADRPARI